MNTVDGTPTQALYGFSSLLLKLLREQRPSGVMLARDLPQKTFRHTLYADYKATRAPLHPELREQLGMLDRLLDALGFPVYASAGFEADDVLATLAAALDARGEHVLVVSGDRDMLQLVRARVHVLFMGQRGKPPTLYDVAAVQARFELSPEQLPSYVALVGDPSDNIPKVQGVGEATAKKLIAQYGNVETLLQHAHDLKQAKLRDTLLSSAEQLRLSERLTQLKVDVPLAQPLVSSLLSAESVERTRALFEAWEFKSLLPRLDAIADKSSDAL